MHFNTYYSSMPNDMRSALEQVATLHLQKYDDVSFEVYSWSVHDAESTYDGACYRLGLMDGGPNVLNIEVLFVPGLKLDAFSDTVAHLAERFEQDHRTMRMALQDSSRDFNFIVHEPEQHRIMFITNQHRNDIRNFSKIAKCLMMSYVVTGDVILMGHGREFLPRKFVTSDELTTALEHITNEMKPELDVLKAEELIRARRRQLEGLPRLFKPDFDSMAVKIRDKEASVNDHLDIINRLEREIEEMRERIFVLEHVSEGVDAPINDFIEYITTHRADTLLHIDLNQSDKVVYLTVLGRDCFVNNDAFKTVYAGVQRRGEGHTYYQWRHALKLMHATFIDRKLRMQLATGFKWNTKLNKVNGQRESINARQFITNYHIYSHDCFRSYKDHFTNACKESAYVTAYEMLIAACQSINVTDGTVFKKFLKVIENEYNKAERSNKKIFIDVESGLELTAYEAYQMYCVEQEDADDNQESTEG